MQYQQQVQPFKASPAVSLQAYELQPTTQNGIYAGEKMKASLKQTRKRMSILESMSQTPKRQIVQNVKSTKEIDQDHSFQSSMFSEDIFQEARSYLSELPQMSMNSMRKSDQEKQNEMNQQDYSINSSEDSFHSCEEELPGLRFNHDQLFEHMNLSVILANEQPIEEMRQETTTITVGNNSYNKSLMNEIVDSRSLKESTNILDIVSQVITQDDRTNRLSDIEEENISDIRSSSDKARGFSSMRLSTRELPHKNSDMKALKCLSSFDSKQTYINKLTQGFQKYRFTVGALEESINLEKLFLDEEQEENPKQDKKLALSPNKSPKKITHNNNRNTIQILPGQQPAVNGVKKSEEEMKKTLGEYYKTSANALTIKKDKNRMWPQNSLPVNRLNEIKRYYLQKQKELQKQAEKLFTFNLTFILYCEINQNWRSRMLFSGLLIWSTVLRLFFYAFCVILYCSDSSYKGITSVMIIMPRVIYALSIFKAIFSYQRQTRSFRQITQLFNRSFDNNDRSEIIKMDELLTSDSFDQLSYRQIKARLTFIVIPSEFNFLGLRNNDVSQAKRNQAYYFSNYVLISLEYMITYVIAFGFCIHHIRYYQNSSPLNFQFLILSVFLLGISLIVFISYSLFYLVLGNLKLRQDSSRYSRPKISN